MEQKRGKFFERGDRRVERRYYEQSPLEETASLKYSGFSLAEL